MEQALRQMTTISRLSDNYIERLEAVARLVTYPIGTMLFSEGETHNQIYFICSGSVRLEMLTPNSGRQTILSLGENDFVAWTSLLGDRVMTATAVVTSETDTLVFDVDELQRLLEADHDLGYQVMRVVAKGLLRRLVATRLQLLDLYRH